MVLLLQCKKKSIDFTASTWTTGLCIYVNFFSEKRPFLLVCIVITCIEYIELSCHVSDIYIRTAMQCAVIKSLCLIITVNNLCCEGLIDTLANLAFWPNFIYCLCKCWHIFTFIWKLNKCYDFVFIPFPFPCIDHIRIFLEIHDPSRTCNVDFSCPGDNWRAPCNNVLSRLNMFR